MAGLGVHLAIGEEVVSRLLAAEDDADVVSIVRQVEADPDPRYVFSTGRAWDPLHRCLTDGTLAPPAGSFPLSHAVLGGVQLCEDDGHLVSLVRPDQVPAVADALTPIDRRWLRTRYNSFEFPGYEGARGDEDFEYMWGRVQGLADFFHAAAQDRRAVIFIVEL
jgi:Domain of unknown function (DUF1877)